MTTLRVATQNLWGRRQPLDERMRVIGDGLRARGVEVAALQEVTVPESGASSAHVVAECMGGHLVVATRFDPGFALAVVVPTRPISVRETPLVSARPGESRRLLSVEVSAELWIHATHLDYRRDDGLWRERQVVGIHRAISSIPGDPLHILCGDMNADPSSDEMRFLRGETTLEAQRAFYQDAWLRQHPGDPGLTWSQESGASRSTRTVDVDRRLDYIYVGERRKDGRGSIFSCTRVAWNEEPGALASDHAAVIAEIDPGPINPAR